MKLSLDDLSPAALETFADLIEERLENPDDGFAPATWHESQARRNAERELNTAMDDAGPGCPAARPIPQSAGALTLH
jgi:hypothetical protein